MIAYAPQLVLAVFAILALFDVPAIAAALAVSYVLAAAAAELARRRARRRHHHHHPRGPHRA